ncbi:hypothetical protein GCM10011583_61520 [Streptomyces camponoticapitis]|uniref:Uncharacterized protein n=1 Tax=Streptomyces camponoticapitis TaxID=1616125 RepID=A0ABQ2EQU1_9ACTN|nr:hypothetical protein [Streptomyces camponoticapitis]GGK21251.1 hypothetical protein GCM10011583_61520 [Streptomyces camponoticapitis]
MLAEEYGYWTSEGSAKETPATVRWMRDQAVRDLRTMKNRGLGLTALGAVLCGAGGYLVQSSSWGAALLGLGPLPLLTGLLLLLFRTRVSGRLPAQLAEMRWQAWPCRLDGPEPLLNRPVSATVTLLSPRRESVRSYQGSVPAATWRRMTDGYGVLWVCGDLRAGLWVADPGGTPVWFMQPATEATPAPASPATPGLAAAAADAAVRQASSAVTRGWLGSMGL